METLSYIIGLVAVIFSGVMVAVMLLTFRKERPVGRFSPLLAALLSLVMLPLFMLLSGARLNSACALPVLACGLLVGLVQGRSTRLYRKDGQVMSKRSLVFLAAWFASLVLAQFLNLVGSVLLVSVALIPLFFSTGTQLGSNGSIFIRRRGIEDAPAPEDRTRVGQPRPAAPSPEARSHVTAPVVTAAPAPAGMPRDAGLWHLVAESGPEAGRRLRLGDRTVVGRGRDSTIRLEDRLVSRTHAVVQRAGQGYLIIDQGSTNGTYVNGHRISQATPLHSGDTISIGNTRLQVQRT